MSMPTLCEYIYCRRTQAAEAQHNIMHALFLVLRSNPAVSCDDDLRQGLTIFNQLFHKYFWSSQEVRNVADLVLAYNYRSLMFSYKKAQKNSFCISVRKFLNTNLIYQLLCTTIFVNTYLNVSDCVIAQVLKSLEDLAIVYSMFCTTQLRGEMPCLGDVAAVAIETLTGSKISFSLTMENPQVRHVLEGLLEHFFSEHLSAYNPADIRWFLETANQQTYWQATYLMDEVIGVEYSDDLLTTANLTPGSPTPSEKEGSVHRLDGCVPMSVFKLYLFRILVKSKMADNTREDDPIPSVLFFFRKCQVCVYSWYAMPVIEVHYINL